MKRILVLLVGMLLLAGCSDSAANDAATPTPSAEVIPASTQQVTLPSPRPTPSLTPTPPPETPEPKPTGTVVNVEKFVNVRSEPSRDADKLGEAPLGEEYVLIDEEPTDGWYKIEYGDGEGYISADYFEIN